MSEDRSPLAPDGSAASVRDDVVPYEGDKGPPESASSGSAGSPSGQERRRGQQPADALTEAFPTAAAPGGPSRREGPARPPGSRPLRYDPRAGTPARSTQRRRARLALTRVDPWSVFVLSLLVSLFLGVVLLVAVGALYSLLASLGVLDSINTFAQDLQIVGDGESVIGAGRVLGVAAVVAALDVVLLTVLSTLGAFLYNVCAGLAGGVEVVLAERE